MDFDKIANEFVRACVSVGLPLQRRKKVKAYGCTRCQRCHREGDALFQKHFWFQSKHGWYWIETSEWEICNQ